MKARKTREPGLWTKLWKPWTRKKWRERYSGVAYIELGSAHYRDGSAFPWAMEKAGIRAKAREKRGIESKPEVMLASDLKEGTRYESNYLITEPGVDAVKLLGRIPTKSVRSVWAQFLVDNLGNWKNVKLFLQVKRVLRDNGRFVVKCYNVNASKIAKSLKTLGFEVREKKMGYSGGNLERLRKHGDLTPTEERYASRGLKPENERMSVILIASKKRQSKKQKTLKTTSL